MKTAYFRRLVVPACTLFLVVLSLFFAQLAFGQGAGSGTIVGKVTDSSGAAASATNPQFYFARNLMGTATSSSQRNADASGMGRLPSEARNRR